MSENTYDEFFGGGLLRKRWDWGATPRMYYEYDTKGVLIVSRQFTADENVIADRWQAASEETVAREQLLTQLHDGVADIQSAVDSAQFDVNVATGLNTSALSIKADATAQRTAIASFTPSATYSQAQMNAVKQQLDQLAARDEVFAQAFADGFLWRKQADLFMVKAYNACLWLARVVSGRLEG